MTVTTIDQGGRLIKAGVNPETADAWYHPGYSMHPDLTVRIGVENIPAWSLSALLSLMPDYALRTTDRGKVLCTNDFFISDEYDNSIDAAVEMVLWLSENRQILTK